MHAALFEFLAGALHPARITTRPLLARGRLLERLDSHFLWRLAVQGSENLERVANVNPDAVHLVLDRPPRGSLPEARQSAARSKSASSAASSRSSRSATTRL
jgi:hypothetical protein